MSSLDLDITKPGRPELREVSPGIYAYIQPDGSWWINNTGFVVGERSVVSIDACSTQRRTRAYLDRIASVTTAPVTTLINTHHHGDHTYGNCRVRRRDDHRSRALPRRGDQRRPARQHRHLGAGRVGRAAGRAADGHVHRPAAGLVRRHADRGQLRRAARAHHATTAWSGCPISRSCSAATCSSTAARRSC